MKKSILEVYALCVCFVSVVCFIIVLGIAAYNTIALIKPEFTMSSWDYSKHQTNDAFWTSKSCSQQKSEQPPEAELTRQREDSFKRLLLNEQRDSAQTLIKCLIVLLIDAFAFILHWQVAKRARG